MIQQGQVFKLKAKGADGEALWAYRYRLAGRGSARRQVGGFATRAEAQKMLQHKLARLGPGGDGALVTLGEWVEEYLRTHPGEPVTIAKLRWLLGKATATLGEVRLADLAPEAICAWRLTVPEGHRFEATQALRQVLNRAVAWKLIEENPAKRGVPNPGRRCREQRPFDSWEQIREVAAQLGPAYGPMVVFAAATGLRPSELFALEHNDVDQEAGVVQIRRAFANGRVKQTKTRLSRRAVPLQAIALEALEQLRPTSPAAGIRPAWHAGQGTFANTRASDCPLRIRVGRSRRGAFQNAGQHSALPLSASGNGRLSAATSAEGPRPRLHCRQATCLTAVRSMIRTDARYTEVIG